MVAYSFKRRFVMNIRAGLNLIMKDDAGNWIECESVIDDGATESHPFDPYKDLAEEARPKRQTIRADGKRRHARPGETLQLYSGMRTKQCFKIGDGKCTAAPAIYLDFRCGILQIEGRDRKKHTGAELDAFGRLDGFGDWADMKQFFLEEHDVTSFGGRLIEWRPFTTEERKA